jgi:phosphoglycolate phosphatase-like HAD superfamily hydrolase
MPTGEPELPALESLLGVVFDLDGTLVLSSHDFARMRRVVIEIAGAHGVMPGHLSVRETIPALLEKALAELEAAGVPEGDRFRFEDEVNRKVDDIEMEALPRTVVRPQALPLVRGLSEKGYRMGVLTRSSERFARGSLEKTGLLPYFPILRTRSSMGPAKPSPDALRLLLEELRVPVERAVYVGDHLLDAECAVRAAVPFVAVLPDPSEGTGATADEFRAAGARAVAKDLRALAPILGLRFATVPVEAT